MQLAQRLFCVATLTISILSMVDAYRMSDQQYTEFIRGWMASCIDSYLPSYSSNELGPAVRKCRTEQCVFEIYKMVADTEKDKFRDFDICFESNTRLNNPAPVVQVRDPEPTYYTTAPPPPKYYVVPPQWNSHYKIRRSRRSPIF
ncbi:hypothetical protein WR25_19387 [Diploscapter pachys]|uniref:Saposin B-type domain-containing protein n=1 Tax=Diploscapter pachys TaxID=2018661 RepID=A0A2A2K9B7_9BILA|nr:hypothetical protein WR25_19387 [Diploscapter pachys]